jgi:hypothetical protein
MSESNTVNTTIVNYTPPSMLESKLRKQFMMTPHTQSRFTKHILTALAKSVKTHTRFDILTVLGITVDKNISTALNNITTEITQLLKIDKNRLIAEQQLIALNTQLSDLVLNDTFDVKNISHVLDNFFQGELESIITKLDKLDKHLIQNGGSNSHKYNLKGGFSLEAVSTVILLSIVSTIAQVVLTFTSSAYNNWVMRSQYYKTNSTLNKILTITNIITTISFAIPMCMYAIENPGGAVQSLMSASDFALGRDTSMPMVLHMMT